MKEEATALMAALSAAKKNLSVGREVTLLSATPLSATPSQSNQSEESKESDDGSSVNLLEQVNNPALGQHPIKDQLFLWKTPVHPLL